MAQVQILYVATTNGLQQLANPGKSDRWRVVGEAFAGQVVPVVLASPLDPLVAFAATGEGVAQTTDGGASWNVVLQRAVTALAADADGTFFAGTNDGVLLRSETGEDWAVSTHAERPIRHLSALGDERLLVVFDDGGVYEWLGGTLGTTPLMTGAISHIAASKLRTEDLFVVTASEVITPTGAQTSPEPLTGALVLLGGKTETLLVGTVGSVYGSPDAIAPLTVVEGEAPQNVQVLVTPPHFLDYAYAGTSSGELWLSKDRGRSWMRLHDNFAAVHDLSFARVQ